MTVTTPTRHVILGNGPAGVVAAEQIRKQRPRDSIVMVGAEPEPPYSRMAIPYLLIGKVGEKGTYLRKDPTISRSRIFKKFAHAPPGWTRQARKFTWTMAMCLNTTSC